MNQPTKEQIGKLPKWAQDYIKSIEQQRFVAVRALDEFVDNQTPSPFYFEDNSCTGEQSGPTNRRVYVQAHCIKVEWRGVHLSVSANDYGNCGEGIRLQWEASGRHGGRDAAFIPSSYQNARLVSKEDMQ